MLELEELDDEKHEGLVLEVMERLGHDEHRLEDEVDEMLVLINSTDETDEVLMVMVDEVDGGDEMVVNEMVVQMMIKEVEEEVVMFFLLLRIGY